MHKRLTLLQTIYRKLRGHILETDEQTLPAMKTLAMTYGVSATMISRAAALLREEGLIDYQRGRRMHVVRNLPAAAPSRMSAQDKIAEILVARLGTGELRSGAQLPKISSLAAAHHASNTTVLAALTALQKKGMVHKRGKAWYAGGAHIARGRIRITTWRRVILVIQDREDRWQWLARLARTGNFCRQCIAEAEQHGVSMISAIAGGSGGASGRFAARIARVKSLIADLRSRYLGTLIVSSVRELPDIAAWVEALTALRRPVVWFDRYGERAPALPDSRYFTRCRFSEEAGCVLAIRALADAGHRECVFPVSAPGWMRWQFHRRDLLSQQAKQASVRMHAFEHMVNDISINSEHGEEAALEAYQPLFRRIPTYRNATALIAPNDYTAALYYRWLSDSGAQIPRQLSLLSFDNDIAVSLLPITTIDFGLGYLGYAAFHTILGAMPIKRDAGVVSSSPRLVDRGSVGAPRRGPLWTPAAAFHGRRRAAGQSQ